MDEKSLIKENERLKEILSEIGENLKKIDKLIGEFYDLVGDEEKNSISESGNIKKLLDKYSRL